MKIAIYSRKSKFTGKGESIENQVEMCYDYIHKNMTEVNDTDISVYEDEGFSAKNLERPQFQQMMKDLEKQHFDYIVVYRLDRISRNVSDFSGLVENLNSKNVSFICIKEQFDTSTPMGRAMMYIASVFAQLERETIAERVRDNMRMLAKTGRWLGGNTPLGYKSEKIVYNSDDGKQRSYFILKPDENSEIVKLIFAKYLEFHSATKVVSYLINHDIKTINGTDYSRVAIRDIVDNPCYCEITQQSYDYFQELGCQLYFDMSDVENKCGFSVYGRKPILSNGKQNIHASTTEWIMSIGKHTPLISADDWLRVQSIRKVNTNKTFYRKVHNKNSLLSGLLYCKQCGHKMRPKVNSRVRADGTHTFYYMCEYKDKTHRERCQMNNVDGLALDKLVCESVLSYDIQGSLLYEQLQNIKNNLSQNNGSQNNELINIDKQIQSIQSNIKNLLGTLIKSNSDDAIYNYIKEEINLQDEKLKQLQAQKEELSKQYNNITDYQKQYEFIKDTLSSFKKSFENLSTIQKREYLRLVISRIEWDGEQADIFLYGTTASNHAE